MEIDNEIVLFIERCRKSLEDKHVGKVYDFDRDKFSIEIIGSKVLISMVEIGLYFVMDGVVVKIDLGEKPRTHIKVIGNARIPTPEMGKEIKSGSIALFSIVGIK